MMSRILTLAVSPRFELTIAKNGDLWPTAANYKKAALQTYYGGVNAEPLVGALLRVTI